MSDFCLTAKLKLLFVSFGIFAAVMSTGVLSTYLLLPETKDMTLEVLSKDEQEGFVRGVTRNIEVRDGVVVAESEYELQPLAM